MRRSRDGALVTRPARRFAAAGAARLRALSAAVALLVLASMLAGFGESPESHNRRGNGLFRDEKYDEALTEYRSAQVLAPELRELAFNAGDALYAKGDMENALREFGLAAAATDTLLSSSALYNSGNVLLSAGQLEAAVEAYRGALRRNPSDPDAKYNLELATMMLEQQQQQQDQNQDKQDQDQQDQNQDQQDQNQDQDKQNQDQQDQNQDKQDQNQQDQNQDKQDQNQSQDQDQQDQQDQSQDKQDQDQDQQDQQDQQPQDGEEGQMSKEDAERLLDAIDQAERELQAEMSAARAKKRLKVEKDW